MRLQGKGLKRVNSYGQGDHYVHFKIKTPDKLTEKQKALMLAFAETEDNSSNSTVDGVVDTSDGEFFK
jgi:DnaJ family protein A protein 3